MPRLHSNRAWSTVHSFQSSHSLVTIHDLPPEVLLQIFKAYLYLDSPGDWSKPTVRHSKETFSTPIPLTHVCRTWRGIATGVADLWTSMFILGPSRKQLSLVNLWLSRAAGRGMTIQFVERAFGITDKQITKLTHQLITLLYQCKDQWEEVDFEFADILGTGERPKAIVNKPGYESYLTRLRKARFFDRQHWNQQLTEALWWEISYCSGLEKLEVGTAHMAPPHANLRELKCEYPVSLGMIMVILDVPHSRLEKLEVAISQPDDHANHFPETIKVVHQRLRHLSITNDYDFSMSPLPIISALTAPNLEYLDVGEMHDEGHTAVFLHELFAFLSRSGCTLRTMRGLPISRHMSEAQLYQLLALPQLRKVRELRVLNATAAFHRLLTAPALPIPPSNRTSFLQCYGAPSVLPRIENLELHRMPVCHREFSDMVLSRMQTLKKVEVKGGVALAVLPLSQRLWEHPDLTVEYITSTDRGDGEDEVPLWADRIRTKTRDHSASFESDRCQDAVIQHRAGSRRPHCSHDPIFHGIRCQGCRDGDCYYTHGVGDTSDL